MPSPKTGAIVPSKRCVLFPVAIAEALINGNLAYEDLQNIPFKLTPQFFYSSELKPELASAMASPAEKGSELSMDVSDSVVVESTDPFHT